MSRLSRLITRRWNERSPDAREGPCGPLESSIHRIDEFKHPSDDQYCSPLFSILPGEVRDLVYEHALADFEDLSRPYDFETCYRRPEYLGPRKTDTSLLRTCQAVYKEAWYMSWTSARHTFFLTAEDRRPKKTTSVEQMARICRIVERLHPNVPVRRKEVANIQIFPQLYLLEPGGNLSRILSIKHFMPRSITITLRHTDIWSWESDAPIHIGTSWVARCRFPPSVIDIQIQVESLERKKAQVDHVTDRIRKEWHFIRTDDVHLVASRKEIPPLRWTGSSTWNNQRWVRDEDDREPGILHYYLATVSFTPAHTVDDAEGYESRRKSSPPPAVDVSREIAEKTRVSGGGGNWAAISLQYLNEAGVSKETPASDAVRMVTEYRARMMARHRQLERDRRMRHMQLQRQADMQATDIVSALVNSNIDNSGGQGN